jgi:hypothetical protein
MKLRIQASKVNDREQLRTLLIDAADQLSGSHSKILEPKLPWDGHPILVADAECRPVLISFDPEQGQSALLNGLQAAEQLATALPWVNQVYGALEQRQLPPRLVVVSQELPPGADTVLACCPHLRLFRCKILRVNEETGLWLEQMNGKADSESGPPAENEKPVAVAPVRQADTDELPSLSDEEAAYFQQL